MLMTAGFSYGSATFWAVMMKIVSIPCFFGNMLVVDKLGRRVVMLTGFIGSFIAWSLMGTFEWSLIKGITDDHNGSQKMRPVNETKRQDNHIKYLESLPECRF